MDGNGILKGLRKVTGDWAKQKKREEREANARLRRRDNLYRERQTTIKEAAFYVMEEAYLKASARGTLPAHARQIMYAARGRILELTDKDHLDDAYFTQVLLPEYIREHGCDTWDVVYDSRGHFQEPHALHGKQVALGTLNVRDYLACVQAHTVDDPSAAVANGRRYPTVGPRHRFGAILFIEKEGFMPLLERVKLTARYDIAVMSTKGFSNVASRHLVDELCGAHEIPLLVLHDFDVSGFGILNSLRDGTERYRFNNQVEVIDLGLRLADVEAYGLESEPANQSKRFSTRGMNDDEATYLRRRRVELNAFASDQFVAFLESKLEEHGIEKVIPDEETLEHAYRRAVHARHLEQTIQHAADEAKKAGADAVVPDSLKRKVEAVLNGARELSWDAAIREIVKNEGNGRGGKQA